MQSISLIRLKLIKVFSCSFLAILGIHSTVWAQSNLPANEKIPPEITNPIELNSPQQNPPLPSEIPQSKPKPSLQIPNNLQIPETTSPSSTPLESLRKVEIIGFTVLKEEIKKKLQDFQDISSKKPFEEKIQPCSKTATENNAEADNLTFTKNCLAAIVKESSSITFEDLLKLRSEITQLYVNKGYGTSGAFLQNNQRLNDGVIKIQITEGELEKDIKIEGLKRLNKNYVDSRIKLAIDKPLNLNRLRTALRLLQQNPLIKEVEAELTPSNTSGRNILIVKLTEEPAFHTDFSVANNISPSIGSTQGTVFITHNNLLGNGDRLNAAYGITEGLDIYNVSYSVPLNPRDGTFSVSYGNNDSNIIEGDFQDLDISSESRTFSVRYSQPLLKTPTNEFALSLGLDLRQSKTFLADEPFSFSVGPEDGESKATVLRFSQDWFNRGNNQIFAVRSQFSIGLDAFDATINDTGTDGQFFAWVGQFQWAQQLPSRIVLVARINTQLTPDSLLPLERLSIGGIETIRGYRENQIVTDNGILGSLEFRIPLTSDSNQLQLVPFFDIGTGWNNDDPNPNPATLASLGTGLRWRIGSGLNLRLDYGIPLTEIDNRGDSLQEDGFHFAVFYRPF